MAIKKGIRKTKKVEVVSEEPMALETVVEPEKLETGIKLDELKVGAEELINEVEKIVSEVPLSESVITPPVQQTDSGEKCEIVTINGKQYRKCFRSDGTTDVELV